MWGSVAVSTVTVQHDRNCSARVKLKAANGSLILNNVDDLGVKSFKIQTVGARIEAERPTTMQNF